VGGHPPAVNTTEDGKVVEAVPLLIVIVSKSDEVDVSDADGDTCDVVSV
jgi:hypothetical protein